MGRIVMVSLPAWCHILTGTSHYIFRSPSNDDMYSFSYCGKRISADLHREQQSDKRCQSCEKRLGIVGPVMESTT